MASVVSQESKIFLPDIPTNVKLPDHTQLPEKDGNFVRNFQEPPQSTLLTDSIEPVLDRLFAGTPYCIGQDSGIYWRITDPPPLGCKSPDWYLVIGVPPLLDGKIRRSYVLWQEKIVPLLAIEYVSGDGTVERDQTPQTGKFWVYEQGIQIPFYAIFEVEYPRVQLHHLVNGFYQLVPPNERGRLSIPPLELELGIWHGLFSKQELPWLRWWDANGNLLLTSKEKEALEVQRTREEHQRAEHERKKAEEERRRADAAEQRAQLLADKLRALGIDPDKI